MLTCAGVNMEGIDKLVERALEMRKQGLTEKEIETELHLSKETVQWLLSGRVKEEKPPSDVYIGWRSIGSRSTRIHLVGEIMADIIEEEMANRDFRVDSLMGLATNGIPLAQSVASILDTDYIIYSVSDDYMGGKLSSNFAGLVNKNVIIVDDVLSSGKTIESAIKAIKESGSNPVLAVVLVNKTKKDDIDGIPVRALVRTIVI